MLKKALVLIGVCSVLFASSVMADNIYVLPESSQRVYSVDEVSDMDLQTMCVARNEIYAKHGRKFVSQELQEWYNMQEWYNGTIEPKEFPESLLSKIEQENVTMLWELEKSRTDGKGYPVDDPSHKVMVGSVDQLNQGSGGWDYSKVYAYLGIEGQSFTTSDFDILSGLHIYTSNGWAVMDADNFYMTLPTAPRIGYNQPDKDSFTIYYAAAKNAGYGGVVVTIKAYDYGDTSYNQLPSYRIAGTNDKKVFVAIFPTDVQFNNMDMTQQTEYGTLLNWAKSIDYSITNSSFRGVTKQEEAPQQNNQGQQQSWNTQNHQGWGNQNAQQGVGSQGQVQSW